MILFDGGWGKTITCRQMIALVFIFTAGYSLFAQIEITDPTDGAYVSGEYEVRLATKDPVDIKRTALYLDGKLAIEKSGWTPRLVVDFGETIERHELYAALETNSGEKLVSQIVITRKLHIDYSETTRVVLLGAVVKSRSNKPIVGLTKNHFSVFENGKPLVIENFYKEQLPLDLVMLLDTSSSLRDQGIHDVKQASSAFINRLETADRVALYEFKRNPHKLLDFTNDRKRLQAKITGLESLGETALFNALHLGLKDLRGRRKGRKALLLFTDGRDSFYDDPRDKARMMRQAIIMAQDQEVTIFTLGLGKKIHRPALERIAEETGGRFYYADNSSKLAQTFSEILIDLKNQYMLGVIPQAQGAGFRKLEIKVKKRGAVVHSRKGYTAR